MMRTFIQYLKNIDDVGVYSAKLVGINSGDIVTWTVDQQIKMPCMKRVINQIDFKQPSEPVNFDAHLLNLIIKAAGKYGVENPRISSNFTTHSGKIISVEFSDNPSFFALVACKSYGVASHLKSVPNWLGVVS